MCTDFLRVEMRNTENLKVEKYKISYYQLKNLICNLTKLLFLQRKP